jgi:hypothetical protein
MFHRDVHISVQKAVVSVEWSAHRGQQRKEKVEKESALLFFFRFKLPGAVKNCVFASSSESLKISFEKLERQRWPSPIDTTLRTAADAPAQASAGPSEDVSQLHRFGPLSQLEARPFQRKQLQNPHAAQQTSIPPLPSSLSTLSLSQAASSQGAPPSASVGNSLDDKNARIAAILHAKGGRKQPDTLSLSERADAATFLSKQHLLSAVALQQYPAAEAETSVLDKTQSALSEASARLQLQTDQIAHLNAVALAATANSAAAQAESREFRSKLASVVADLEKCKMELKVAKAQTNAQQQKLDFNSSHAEKQALALERFEATVSELEMQLKEAASTNSLLESELNTIRARNDALTLELHAAQSSILTHSKTKVDACVGVDAIPIEEDGVSSALTDCIEESQLLLSMAEENFIAMRHRNQLLLDRFYEHEALRLHRILKSSSKKGVTFNHKLEIGEFHVNDAPDSVYFSRKSVNDPMLDIADKSQKRRKKCEGLTKRMHAQSQALCYSSHAMCIPSAMYISSQPVACVLPPVSMSCRGKVISSLDLQQWFLAASTCTKFQLHPVRSPPLAPLRHRSQSVLKDHAREGLQSIYAASGGLSHASLCQLFFAFRGCSTLKSIDFSFNHFTELVAAALGSLLATACITHLRLSSCDISSGFISRMQLALPWLIELDLSNNDLRDDGFFFLTSCLQTTTCCLKKLNCANNSLSSLSCKTLCAALDLNASLQFLILDDNVSLIASLTLNSSLICLVFRSWIKECLTFSIFRE